MKEDSQLSEHISVSIWIQYNPILQRNDLINTFQEYLIFEMQKKMNLKAHKSFKTSEFAIYYETRPISFQFKSWFGPGLQL